ncbi:MAG: pyridoxamine 5'-phosphate oxidase family protein [Microthrixaceae bacterium]|nr:pyridoxamine 5'-phosphate oxidase family protein [Microthrixaceae bacterium]
MSGEALRWAELPGDASDLAAAVRERFEAHPHHVLATLHLDGRPRVSGTNVMFGPGTLWIGSMPGALKSLDLRRDPRCALHSAPLSEELAVQEADARIEAVAVALGDDEAERLLVDAFGDDASMDGDMWELRIRSMSLVHVEGDRMWVRSWSPDRGEEVVSRS